MARLVERSKEVRDQLEAWIREVMKSGLHFGIIPIAGRESSKPTLLKPGAELVALLFGWRFHLTADLDSLQMYGGQPTGTFAYICHVIDRVGGTVGQGRGVAELREPEMQNANECVKMALKRAQVDAVLRCAGLSQWFTQDLEEPQYVAPESHSHDGADTPATCTPAELRDMRACLKMAGRSEEEVLRHYRIERLEELSSQDVRRVIQRLIDIRRQKAAGNGRA
jgi:hypothetical protein